VTRPGRDGDDSAAGRKALWVLAVIGVVAGGYYAWRQLAVEPTPPPEVIAPPPVAAAGPAIAHPVTPPTDAATLPGLDASDAAVADELAGLLGRERYESLVLGDDLVRRLTATIDNLPREKVATRLRPLKPIDSPFVASGEEGAYTLGPDNYVRYEPYVALVEALDSGDVAALYTRLYPLFQQAYAELGNLDGYFNDRVVEVIDHLLATPEIQGPIPLSRPGVMFQFADPALESRSAGQKFLLRMGPDNAARIKDKLRGLRARIASQPPPAGQG